MCYFKDFELLLCDTQPACLGGAFDEFIFGPRLDNLVGTYCSIMGLIESTSDEKSLQNEEGIRIAAVYDHEEVGSESAQGAASAITEHVLRRLSDPNSFELAMSRSFLISADQAHAVHPNYSEMHEENHRPAINGGVVLKYNSNQRYTTNSVSAAVLREACKIANVPVQGKTNFYHFNFLNYFFFERIFLNYRFHGQERLVYDFYDCLH
jgi:aspartyl aminopeptidase